jgi:hypothetical protein
LPSDLRDDPAYALNYYNWATFGAWEFHPRGRAGYPGGNEEDKDKGHDDALLDNTAAPCGGVNEEVQPADFQPVDLMEEETLKMAIT